MDIYESAFLINEMIKKEESYLLMKKYEKMMLEDNDTFILLNKYQAAIDAYNEALKYQDYGTDVVSYRQKLYSLKLEVDNNYYVKQYVEQYRKVKDLLAKINDTILEGVK